MNCAMMHGSTNIKHQCTGFSRRREITTTVYVLFVMGYPSL